MNQSLFLSFFSSFFLSFFRSMHIFFLSFYLWMLYLSFASFIHLSIIPAFIFLFGCFLSALFFLLSVIYRQSPIFFISYKNTFCHIIKKMATFIALRHPVTILVTVFTNPNNLTNDMFILKLPYYYLAATAAAQSKWERVSYFFLFSIDLKIPPL